MIGALIVVLMLTSVFTGIYTGRLSEVSAAALESCTDAVELTLLLAGSMALWGGLMKVAEKSGITKALGKITAPIVGKLFPTIKNDPKAQNAVTMNITANLLGLGNAATPLGISAAKELNKSRSPFAKRNTAMLVVLNTASIQLIPSTIGAMRLAHGAKDPFDVTLPILIVSLLSAAAGCIMVSALYIKGRKTP